MAATTRIYRVDEMNEKDEITESFLVRAPNPAQAKNFIAERFCAALASQQDLVELTAKGVKVQVAAEQSGGDPPPTGSPPAGE